MARDRRYAARVITRQVAGVAPPPPFAYFDKGNMAVIGRTFAILESGRIKLAGVFAWWAWAGIHLAFLPATGNRIVIFTRWVWSHATHQQQARLILGSPPSARKTPAPPS